MKKLVLAVLVSGLAMGVFAKSGDFEGRGSINSVQKETAELPSGKEVVRLTIKTTQGGGDFQGELHVGIAIQDKNKDVFYGTLMKQAPAAKVKPNGDEPTGGIEWEFDVDASQMKRPKIIAYTVEFRCEVNGESILLADDYYKVDDPAELEEEFKATAASVKLKGKGKLDYPSYN